MRDRQSEQMNTPSGAEASNAMDRDSHEAGGTLPDLVGNEQEVAQEEEGYADDGRYVWVRRQWNDWRRAKSRVEDVEKIHWDRWSGGVGAPAPQYFLHGYVYCDEILEGELAHSCIHGREPHRIKVCITKKDNDPRTFAELDARAPTPKPAKNKR